VDGIEVGVAGGSIVMAGGVAVLCGSGLVQAEAIQSTSMKTEIFRPALKVFMDV
jgi:hypothetical protein